MQTQRMNNLCEATTSPKDSRAIQWLTAISFLISSSLLFLFLFEWERYCRFLGGRTASLSWTDAGLMLWLLIAKSMLWFVPLLPFMALLTVLGFQRAAAVALVLSWVFIFYFMATDVICVGFQGWHLWDYAPYLQYVLKNPDQSVWQWTKEWIPLEAGVLFLLFAVAGTAWFFAVRWTMRKVSLRWRRLTQREIVAGATVAFALIVSGMVWAPDLCYDRPAMDRVFDALPYPSAVTERIQRKTITASFSQPNRSSTVTELPPMPFSLQDELLAMRLIADAAAPGPVDESAFVQRPNLPNIILIIFESFRHSAISPDLMTRVHTWSEQGLRLNRHYSGSNCSHLGLFSMFYSRAPLAYHETLDRKIPSQFFTSLRRSGYRITFLTCGETKGFRKVDSYINKDTCDAILSKGRFELSASKEWPDTDRWKLEWARNAVQGTDRQPQFIFFYLVSSHYPYEFPPEFQVLPQPSRHWQFLSPRERIRGLTSRYVNSLLFLEHELMKLFQSIDPERNIVIVTGDHGESLGEDGVFIHASRMSEIQIRVPFVMVGPGVPRRQVSTATVHMDVLPTLLRVLAGRPVPIAHSDGRDLVAESNPPDRVVVVPANGKQWDGLVVVSGNKRLAFSRIMSREGNVELDFAGEIDEGGDFLPRRGRDPATQADADKLR
ncbi:MAG: sulfatase-like hydrolase/transferase [Thermodesulfobacteriota bacterium]